MRVVHGVSAERADFRRVWINPGESLQIMRREIEARLYGLPKVERVIADLHIIEHPRPHESILIFIAEAHEEGFRRFRPDTIGSVERLSYVSGAARPLAHGKVESRAEDGRIDPAAKDVANRLVDRRRRGFRLRDDRKGIELIPTVEQRAEQLVAILEIPVEARPRHAEPFAQVKQQDMVDALKGEHGQR